MKNLVFFDVDETLVTKDENGYLIPESTTLALKLLRRNGNLCFINSGRTIAGMEDIILDIGVDGFVCGCGTYICIKDKILFSRTIPHELGNELIKDLIQCRLELVLEGQSSIYYIDMPHKTRIRDFKEDHQKTFPGICKILPPEDAYNLSFDKFCICTSPGCDFEYFHNKYNKEFDFIDRGNNFFEIVPRGCSKATGMKFLMDYYNIPVQNTYAIGDSTNDLPMINFAGTGIVMGNSPACVTCHADYVTGSILEDGIYNAMEHYKLI